MGSLITQCMPVVSSIAAWVLLGETLTALTIVGGLIVLAATAAILVRSRSRGADVDVRGARDARAGGLIVSCTPAAVSACEAHDDAPPPLATSSQLVRIGAMRFAIRSSWPGAGCTPSEESSSSLTNVSQSATTAFGYCDTSPWMWMFTPGMFSSGPCVVCQTTSGMCFSASRMVTPFARNAAGSASFVPSSTTTTSGRRRRLRLGRGRSRSSSRGR